MKTTIRTNDNKEYVVHVCDVCSNRIQEYTTRVHITCRLCNRELCINCISNHYCPNCLPFGNIYNDQCDKLYKEQNRQQKLLWQEAQKNALAKLQG